ncbi:MAG: VOC family protein, partial [Bacteroidia bacterium]
MSSLQKITTNLWYDGNAEEAVKFYTSVFKNSGVGKTSYFGKEGFEIHGRPEGSVMTISFHLEGREFVA